MPLKGFVGLYSHHDFVYSQRSIQIFNYLLSDKRACHFIGLVERRDRAKSSNVFLFVGKHFVLNI